jgi:hypothetical protein
MDIRLLYPSARSARYRFLATGLLVVFMATLVMRVDAQQLVPFGDVPATENFSEAGDRYSGTTARSPANVHAVAQGVFQGHPRGRVENGLSHDHQR